MFTNIKALERNRSSTQYPEKSPKTIQPFKETKMKRKLTMPDVTLREAEADFTLTLTRTTKYVLYFLPVQAVKRSDQCHMSEKTL